MWNSETDVMIVFPDISAMLVSEGIQKRKEGSESAIWLYVLFTESHKIKVGHADRFRVRGKRLTGA